MPTVYIKDGDNFVPLPGQVIPTKADIGTDEGWDFVTLHDVKDMAEDHSTHRSLIARISSQDALRSMRRIDHYEDLATKAYLEDRRSKQALENVAALQLNTAFNAILASLFKMSDERMATKADVTAAQMAWDSQRVVETALEGTTAATAGTQGAGQAAMVAGLADQAWTQSAAQSAMASGLANQAWTQGFAQSLASVKAITPVLEAMQVTLAKIEAMLATKE
jgi:hypothetical protein